MRMPAITTPAPSPIPTASDRSAMFIVVFLLFELMEMQKARRNVSPGFGSGLSSRSVDVRGQFGCIWFLVGFLMCHLQADTTPIQ
jgi:hypothetical protein